MDGRAKPLMDWKVIDLSHSLSLLLSFSDYQPTHLSIYLPIYLSIYSVPQEDRKVFSGCYVLKTDGKILTRHPENRRGKFWPKFRGEISWWKPCLNQANYRRWLEFRESSECFKYHFFSFPNIPRVFCLFSRGHSSLYAVFRPEGGLLLFSVQCKKVAMDYKKGKPKAF